MQRGYPYPNFRLRDEIPTKVWRQADKDAKTHVICERESTATDETMKNLTNIAEVTHPVSNIAHSYKELDQQVDSYNLAQSRCEMSTRIAKDSYDRVVRKVKEELSIFGIDLPKTRAKRHILKALFGNGILQLPFMAWDLYSDHVDRQNIEQNQQDIKENAMNILRNAHRLDDVQIDVTDLQRGQALLRQTVTMIKAKLQQLDFGLRLQQVLLTLNQHRRYIILFYGDVMIL